LGIWSSSDPIPNDACYAIPDELLTDPDASVLAIDGGFAIAGVIFGRLHFAAWNSSFRTSAEKMVWRIANAIATIALPIFYTLRMFRS
jgi:hypothetical protein